MAGQRLTDKTALDQQAGSGDLLMVVDVNDTTGSAEGTSKKMDFKYVIQTDKISLSNAEIGALNTTPKTLAGALSGYMITPINVTVLITYAAPSTSSNSVVFFGYDSSTNLKWWSAKTKFFQAETADLTYIFTADQATGGIYQGSIVNRPFLMWSSNSISGGLTMDVYFTYAYTKLL